MSVHALYDAAKRKSAMWCSTSGRAFGPVFDNEDAVDFADWMLERGRDPRDMNDNTLDVWVKTWQAETEADADGADG